MTVLKRPERRFFSCAPIIEDTNVHKSESKLSRRGRAVSYWGRDGAG
jgi:hypothetical protein